MDEGYGKMNPSPITGYIEFMCGKYSPSDELTRNYNKMDWGAFSKALKESKKPSEEHRTTLWDICHMSWNGGDLKQAAAAVTLELQTILDIICSKKVINLRIGICAWSPTASQQWRH
jgi:hypothetical protein